MLRVIFWKKPIFYIAFSSIICFSFLLLSFSFLLSSSFLSSKKGNKKSRVWEAKNPVGGSPRQGRFCCFRVSGFSVLGFSDVIDDATLT